jgi:TPR repeat protein
VCAQANEPALRAEAALRLGFLMTDATQSQRDATEAMKWFKLAASLGCTDAQDTVGWLLNTGQF